MNCSRVYETGLLYHHYANTAYPLTPRSFMQYKLKDESEIKEIGYLLNLPRELVDKTPIDGLCGKTDEDNFGFTYAELDRYIRTGEIEDLRKKEIIDRKHKANLFKLALMPSFKPEM